LRSLISARVVDARLRMTIRFYRVNAPYGFFSNFSPHPIEIDGRTWPTTEHSFQAMKYEGTASEERMEAIREKPSPAIAKRMGWSKRHPIRPDWETVKLNVMRRAIRAKFAQHDDIRAMLVGTDDHKLIEAAAKDAFWGEGADGRGKNWLGKILMEIRAELRGE
jgi:ribA/ribD-fused uncharacterized protein